MKKSRTFEYLWESCVIKYNQQELMASIESVLYVMYCSGLAVLYLGQSK